MFRNMNATVDLAAPGAVVAIDLITLEMAPEYNKTASYVMTAVGYGAALLGIGGGALPFLKNMGVASLPLTARNIYEYVKAQSGTARRATSTSRMALRPVSQHASPVSRQYQPEFEGAGSHAF